MMVIRDRYIQFTYRTLGATQIYMGIRIYNKLQLIHKSGKKKIHVKVLITLSIHRSNLGFELIMKKKKKNYTNAEE